MQIFSRYRTKGEVYENGVQTLLTLAQEPWLHTDARDHRSPILTWRVEQEIKKYISVNAFRGLKRVSEDSQLLSVRQGRT